jgi:hypothetical protein
MYLLRGSKFLFFVILCTGLNTESRGTVELKYLKKKIATSRQRQNKNIPESIFKEPPMSFPFRRILKFFKVRRQYTMFLYDDRSLKL